jgi:hypothetical protein
MGYVRAHLRLSFDDPELAEFVVRAKRLSVDRLLELSELRHLAGLKDDDSKVREGLKQVFEALAKVITSWNLEELVDPEDPDGPTRKVPVTAATIADQDLGLLTAIIDALQDATTGVSGPLGQTSSGGEPSLEESIQMDVLPENPTS